MFFFSSSPAYSASLCVSLFALLKGLKTRFNLQAEKESFSKRRGLQIHPNKITIGAPQVIVLIFGVGFSTSFFKMQVIQLEIIILFDEFSS